MKTNWIILLGIGAFLVPQDASADKTDWPQWRGPNRDGVSAGKAWPDSLSADNLKLVWRKDLEPSYSGPIVVGGKIITTETVNQESETIKTFDLATGKPGWDAKWEGSMRVPFFARSNGSWIRSTPASDGKSVFVAGMRDVLVSYDVKSGKENWRLDFAKKFDADVPTFGFVCSPLLDGDSVIVQAGGSVFRLKKSDGSVIWRSLQDGGGMNGSAFSSPVIAQVAGKRQLLVQTRKELTGLDPKTGKVYWKQVVKAFRGMNILTPIPFGKSSVFTSSYGGRSLMYDVSTGSEAMSAKVAWDVNRQGYMSTPVVIDNHVWLHLRNQRISCIDLATGKEKFYTDEKFGKYMSFIGRGDKMLALDQNGTLYLLRANTGKLNVISKRKVSNQETWAHLAISGDKLIIRELKGLSVYQWK